MKIFPERFEEFQTDAPAEFYAGNKPPWAPRIQDRALAQARKWKLMEIYDHHDLSETEWYAFLERVAGYCGMDDTSEFARTETTGERSGATAPSRIGDPLRITPAGGGGGGGSSFGAIGMGGSGGGGGGGGRGGGSIFSEATQGLETMTTPDIRRAPRDGGPTGIFASIRSTALGRGSALRPRSLSPGFTTESEGDARGAGREPTTTMQTARFKAERRELMDRLHEPDILDITMAPADREARRQERIELVRALPWIYRPQVTGVFMLSAKYTAALASAYAKTQIYAASNTTLMNVPLMEFMRRRSTRETNGDMASYNVRETFAECVATLYFLTKDSTHKGSRFQIDRQANLDRSNELLRLMRNRFGYNGDTRCFYDITARNDERYQAPQERYSTRTSYPFATVFPQVATASVGPSVFRPF